MSHFTTAGAIRRSKVLIVFMASLFGLMTLINNFTDYAAYSDYIGQIISMSDTQGNDSRRYRAVTSTMFHHRFYWTIITLEIIFTFSFLLGTYQLFRKLSAPREEFHEAKKYAIVGFSTALFVYQTLYVTILNEWFDMDYSAQRSAFEWARNNIEYMFLALIYLLVAKDY
jgi:predicted small integral membrane protein